MGTPKTLAGYPYWYFSATEAAAKQGEFELEVKSESAGITERRRWYSWRKIVDAQGHPARMQANGLMLQVKERDGRWYLVFNNIGGITDEALASLGEKAKDPEPSLPKPEPEEAARQVMTDEEKREGAEGFIEGWLREKKGAAPSESSGPAPVIPLGPKRPDVMIIDDLGPEDIDKELQTGEFAETKEEKEYRLKVEGCEHAWDMYGSCKKCGVSKIAWERGDWKR